MLRNFFLDHSPPLCPHMGFFINGVAERKIRYLVGTARTLLLHHKVLQCFWGDAILAVCYLINRMPSSVLDDKISHSILFPNQPLFYLPSRVFGCVCFPYSYFWTRQAFNQSQEVCLPRLFLASTRLSLLLS